MKTFSFPTWKKQAIFSKTRTENNATDSSFSESLVSTKIIFFFYAIEFHDRPKSFQWTPTLKSKKTIKMFGSNRFF